MIDRDRTGYSTKNINKYQQSRKKKGLAISPFFFLLFLSVSAPKSTVLNFGQ